LRRQLSLTLPFQRLAILTETSLKTHNFASPIHIGVAISEALLPCRGFHLAEGSGFAPPSFAGLAFSEWPIIFANNDGNCQFKDDFHKPYSTA
jgi:hypothetical protein